MKKRKKKSPQARRASAASLRRPAKRTIKAPGHLSRADLKALDAITAEFLENQLRKAKRE